MAVKSPRGQNIHASASQSSFWDTDALLWDDLVVEVSIPSWKLDSFDFFTTCVRKLFACAASFCCNMIGMGLGFTYHKLIYEILTWKIFSLYYNIKIYVTIYFTIE